MNEHTKHQIIRDATGAPVFAVVPYDEYLDLVDRRDREVTIPHAVVKATVLDDKSLVKAWREYKKLSQKEVATRMGVSQAAYSQMEKADAKLQLKTIERIAAALDVLPEQLME